MSRVDGLQIARRGDGALALRVSMPGADLNATSISDEHLRFSSDWASTMPLWYSSPVLRVAKGVTMVHPYPSALSYLPFATYMYREPGASYWRTSASSFVSVAFAASAATIAFSSQSSYAYVDVFFKIYRMRAF